MVKVNLLLTDKDMEEDKEDQEVKSIEDMRITPVQDGVTEDLEITTLITEMSMTDTILTEKDITDMNQDTETVAILMTIIMMRQTTTDLCHMEEEVPDLSTEQGVSLREIFKTIIQITTPFIMIQGLHTPTESEDHSAILEIMDMSRV